MDVDHIIQIATAIAPVLVLLLVLDRLDAFNLIKFRTILLLLVVGGAAAGIALLCNGGVLRGFPIGWDSYTRYVAPGIEESLKGAPIVVMFALNRLGYKLDAAIAGFAIGAGFSVAENLWLFEFYSGENFSGWMVRGFGTAIMHGGATAIFAAISHEMSESQLAAQGRYRFNPLLFIPGFLLAYAIHSAFNHFPSQPLLAMALTLLIVPLTLFFVLARSEQATHRWLKSDHEAHVQALDDLRTGRFAESAGGQALRDAANRFGPHVAADVLAYLELKTELVLRAEEAIMATIESGSAPAATPDDREKVERLDAMERKLGRMVLAAVGPRLGFTRNDLWELSQFKARAKAAHIAVAS